APHRPSCGAGAFHRTDTAAGPAGVDPADRPGRGLRAGLGLPRGAWRDGAATPAVQSRRPVVVGRPAVATRSAARPGTWIRAGPRAPARYGLLAHRVSVHCWRLPVDRHPGGGPDPAAFEVDVGDRQRPTHYLGCLYARGHVNAGRTAAALQSLGRWQWGDASFRRT